MLTRLKSCLPAMTPWSWERCNERNNFCRQDLGKVVKNLLKIFSKCPNGGNGCFLSEPHNFSMEIWIMTFLRFKQVCSDAPGT